MGNNLCDELFAVKVFPSCNRPMPKTLLPSPNQRLRMLAHTRRLGGIMLPLGAAIGLAVALALRGWAGWGVKRTSPWWSPPLDSSW